MENLRWDDVRVLLALYRGATLSAAAKELGASVSTVSRRLEALEKVVGARLFDRSASGVKPSGLADRLFPIAERMESAALDVMAECSRDSKSEPQGVVRLAGPPGLMEHFIAPLIASLAEALPKIRVELDASVGYVNLARREADIALRAKKPTSGDVVWTRVLEAPLVPLGSEALVSTTGKLRQWTDAKWVDYSSGLSHLQDSVWLRKRVKEEHLVVRTDDFGARIQVLRAGVGLALMAQPYAMLEGLAVMPTTKALASDLKSLDPAALYMASHRSLRHEPRVAAVWDFLRTSLSEHAPS